MLGWCGSADEESGFKASVWFSFGLLVFVFILELFKGFSGKGCVKGERKSIYTDTENEVRMNVKGIK